MTLVGRRGYPSGWADAHGQALANPRRRSVSEPESIGSGPSNRLDGAFRITVALKGLDGLLEIVGGLVLLSVSPCRCRR